MSRFTLEPETLPSADPPATGRRNPVRGLGRCERQALSLLAAGSRWRSRIGWHLSRRLLDRGLVRLSGGYGPRKIVSLTAEGRRAHLELQNRASQ